MAIIKKNNPSTTPLPALNNAVIALRTATQKLQFVVDLNGEYTDAQLAAAFEIDVADVTTFRNLCSGALTAITNVNLTNFIKRIIP